MFLSPVPSPKQSSPVSPSPAPPELPHKAQELPTKSPGLPPVLPELPPKSSTEMPDFQPTKYVAEIRQIDAEMLMSKVSTCLIHNIISGKVQSSVNQ